MSILGLYNQRVANSPKGQSWQYKGWAKGANNFAEDNEIRPDEFYDAENIEIIGRSSIRMPMRGRRIFAYKTGATVFNGWGIYKEPNTGVDLMLAAWNGHLYSITSGGVVTEIDPAVTFDASARIRGILLREWWYFGNAVDYMAKTDGTSIVTWNTIAAAAGLALTHSTGSGDEIVYAYTVTAVTANGETEACTEETIFAGTLKDGSEEITVEWTRKTDAEVVGYNIYKAIRGGTLYFITRIDQQAAGATMSFIDDGTYIQSLTHEAPTFNTTGGVKGNIFDKYASSLFVAGNPTVKDAIFYGGTGTQYESFSPDANGGWIKPGWGDGDEVTGMIGFEDFLLVFKNNSIWKFVFASDGGPSMSAVIPQYGTPSPDTVKRFEKDVIFYGTDGRIRVLGYEPTQLNVIRTTDISNRIQPDLDAIDMSSASSIFAEYFEQKYILCDGATAFPYDRRYTAFLKKWTNYNFSSFIQWDAGTGRKKLYGAETATGKIYQLLVDGTYDNDGDTIHSYIRFKRVDGGDDTYLKYYRFTKTKIKNPRGNMTFGTYKDGETLVDTILVPFSTGGGIDEYMFDEPMFDESVSVDTVSDAIKILNKELYFEAYSIYHDITVEGNSENHVIIQSMNGVYETEDMDYLRDETNI